MSETAIVAIIAAILGSAAIGAAVTGAISRWWPSEKQKAETQLTVATAVKVKAEAGDILNDLFKDTIDQLKVRVGEMEDKLRHEVAERHIAEAGLDAATAARVALQDHIIKLEGLVPPPPPSRPDLPWIHTPIPTSPKE
ncbi:MAG: hypothetical protein PSX37_12055 [bacterium]|nr:hypothetical protein [bacterium]